MFRCLGVCVVVSGGGCVFCFPECPCFYCPLGFFCLECHFFCCPFGFCLLCPVRVFVCPMALFVPQPGVWAPEFSTGEMRAGSRTVHCVVKSATAHVGRDHSIDRKPEFADTDSQISE